MAMASGTAFSIYDIIETADQLLTTNGYEVHQKLYYPVEGKKRICNCIWKYTVDDMPVFIQLRADIETHKRLFVDCPTACDELLYCWEQPGSIAQWLHVKNMNDFSKSIPMITLEYGELFPYFMLINDRRLIISCRESVEYETAYIGYFDALNKSRQYAYPVFVSGNGACSLHMYPDTSGSFINNLSGNSWVRQPSGEWYNFSGMIDNKDNGTSLFPYNSTTRGFVTSIWYDYKNQTRFYLMPILIPHGNDNSIAGKLNGVYYISGDRDLRAEDIVNINNKKYIILDNKMDKGKNTYFAVAL